MDTASPRIVTLQEPASGAEARILVAYGLNCFALRLVGGGAPRDVIWAEEQFEAGDRRASGSGIPLLFPFPGRVQGTTLLWQGNQYPLEEGDGRGNAIHGFVHNRPWRVLEQSQTQLVAQFHASLDDPELLRHWPSDFRITTTYRLTPEALYATFLVENPDEHPLPCGLGVHPYFRLPLGGSDPDSCIVKLPVRRRWELQEMIVTGRQLPLDHAAQYQQGQPFGQLQLDDVFTELLFENNRCEAAIEDPASAQRVTISFDEAFPHCVVYTPGHRQAICIEPYSCVPGAVQLEQRGVPCDLWLLQPGQLREANMSIRLSGLGD